MNSFTYDSQTKYPHGRTMCTSACISYVIACIQHDMHPTPEQEFMHVLMEHAGKLHKHVQGNSEVTHLMQWEVCEKTTFPPDVEMKEWYGTVQNEVHESLTSCCIPMHKVSSLLEQEDSGFVFTAKQHTLGVVSLDTKLAFIFDPLVASVDCMPTDKVNDALKEYFSGMEEFYITQFQHKSERGDSNIAQ